MKKFTILLPVVFLFASFGSGFAQSPYFSIKFTVTESPPEKMNLASYEITSETCNFEYDPFVPSGDYWFGIDTSVLDWDNLPDSMYSVLSCSQRTTITDNYEYSNQGMIWENIYKYRIVKNNTDTMIVLFPVLVKSFRTSIDLGAIPFSPGYFEITRDLVYIFNDHVLSVTLPDNYLWKSINFEDRKIKLEK